MNAPKKLKMYIFHMAVKINFNYEAWKVGKLHTVIWSLKETIWSYLTAIFLKYDLVLPTQ
jgi:hypothetical protein